MLSRLGIKTRLAQKIQNYFPPHRCYIEPFFGAGGMFFNKRLSQYNMLNDLDGDVFNFFQVLMNSKEELKKAFYVMPIHSDLLKYWKFNEETEPVKRALRFLFLSNMVMPTTGDLRRQCFVDRKIYIYDLIDKTSKYLFDANARFFNEDFRTFIDRIMLKGNHRPLQDRDTFIYCDPPYLNTSNNYSHGFSENDTRDLFSCLIKKGVNFAVSEFDNDFVLDLAKEQELNVITIGERWNLRNRRTEILITNYENQPSLFH